jgi:putative tryptophan/tyrosine transport system substrate-binding protein
MNRRDFITLVGASPLFSRVVKAQGSAKLWRIGQVRSGSPDQIGPSASALEHRLTDLGHTIGTDIRIINRFVLPQQVETEDAIKELLPNIDLLVVWGTLGAVAARKLASSLPVVFVSVAAPVEMGLVESLAHPGGNMTGITFEAATETYAKRLQILKEIAPNLSRVAVLGPAGDLNMGFAISSIQKAAPLLGLTLLPLPIKSADDLAATFEVMQSNRADGLLSVAGNLTSVLSRRIAELALTYQLPSCHPFRETVIAGGLIGLGPDRVWMAKQAADYVDKIAHGTAPADLPVQQPDRYEMWLNLQTAKVLHLSVPPTLLARADEVIE